MSDYDELLESGNRQLARLDAAMVQANAEYQQHRLSGDTELQDAALQTWSDLENQKVNLWNSYNRQLAAAQATMPKPLSAEEKAAKPFSAMNHGDVYEMLKHSKYGIDDDAFARGIDYVRQNPSSRQR